MNPCKILVEENIPALCSHRRFYNVIIMPGEHNLRIIPNPFPEQSKEGMTPPDWLIDGNDFGMSVDAWEDYTHRYTILEKATA